MSTLPTLTAAVSFDLADKLIIRKAADTSDKSITGTLMKAAFFAGGASNSKFPIMVALTPEQGSAITSVGARTIRAPYAYTLTGLKINVNTAPTGAAIIVDIKKNGTSIFTTKVQIDAGSTTSVGSGTPYVLTGAITFASDDIISFDVTQVGSTIAGAGLKATLLGYET